MRGESRDVGGGVYLFSVVNCQSSCLVSFCSNAVMVRCWSWRSLALSSAALPARHCISSSSIWVAEAALVWEANIALSWRGLRSSRPACVETFFFLVNLALY